MSEYLYLKTPYDFGPQDVANVVLFLSSSLSDYISGQIIGVDGSYSI